MKKTIAIVLMCLVAFTAFAQGAKEASAVATNKVGMVTDSGTIDDRSFNHGTYEGIKQAAEELSASHHYLKPAGTSITDYITAISDLADAGYKFVGCPGFLFADAVGEAQALYPDVSFVIIDSEPTGGVAANTVAIYFNEHESGFIAGLATALQLKEGATGFVGGIEIPSVQKFSWGFQQGIAYANQHYGTKCTMAANNYVYSGSFSDLALGQQLATTMYNNGVKVIFAAAGGTGLGVINEAKTRRLAGEDVWVIGVDEDQYADGDMGNGKSCILTSAMKLVDVAAYEQAKAYITGAFKGGQVITLGVTDGAVGLPSDNPNLDDSVEAEVAKVVELLKAGKITVQDNPNGLLP